MSPKIQFNFSWIHVNDCFDTTACGQLLYLGHESKVEKLTDESENQI